MAENENKDAKKPTGPKFNFYWVYGLIFLSLIAAQFLLPLLNSTSEEITWNRFENDMLKAKDVKKLEVVNEKIVQIYIKPEALTNSKYEKVALTPIGSENLGPHYFFAIGSLERFEKKLDEAQADVSAEEEVIVYYVDKKDWFGDLLGFILPILIIVVIWFVIMRRVSGGMGGGGGQIFNIGKSKATLFDKDTKVTVTFNDVAGLEEAKEEVMEIVDFLRVPEKYTALGGKIPKGALLVGPPGTGKTLLAKAMAGEAKVPFYSISGSDFVEMFVGVGASRVRDLFKQAREKAPCIIFIDEIDAIGRARGKNMMQSNDERENTLNQLLVEMDGFGTDSGVIILAATNRPDVLDPALLRPGRFDRQISIDKPDIKGRAAIFKVHMGPLKIVEEVDENKLSAQTPGFAGAEIANVCNEAALIAARKNKKHIDMKDFQDAIDRVIGGLEKKNKIISPDEKKIIAFHEAGHAVCGWFLEHADPLVKVSIIPRGVAALGYAQYLPKEQYLHSKEQLIDSMCMTLGGRAAEEVIFGSITTGAQNDLERITQMAYAMITVYGMNERVGNVSFYDAQREGAFTKPYSDDLAQIIDEEVKILIDTAYERTKNVLKDKGDALTKVANELLDKEILFRSDLERLLGPRPAGSTAMPAGYDHNEDNPIAEVVTTEEDTSAPENTSVESSIINEEAASNPNPTKGESANNDAADENESTKEENSSS